MLTRHNLVVARNTIWEEVSCKVNEYSVCENTLYRNEYSVCENTLYRCVDGFNLERISIFHNLFHKTFWDTI